MADDVRLVAACMLSQFVSENMFSDIFCYTFICELFKTEHETYRSLVDIFDNTTEDKAAIRCIKT